MIDLYTAPTPNGHKASCTLEELRIDYTVKVVDISSGEQHTPAFRAINPNGRIPAIVDRANGDFAVFESGAIMISLAEQAGKLLPADAKGRSRVIQWLMFQMGGIGPFLGQAFHFKNAAPEDIPYAKKRYADEALRLFGVMDRRLSDSAYLAAAYSIADIACYPWVAAAPRLDLDLQPFPHLSRWMREMAARPAVEKGMTVP